MAGGAAVLISLTIPATYPDPLFAIVGYSSFWTKPRDGWSVDIMICPARRLMRPSEGGKRVLCGLFIGVELRWPWGQRDAFLLYPWWDQHGWRSPLSIEVRSNADEIARRLAKAGARHG
jgi:hypothetical protein